MDPLHPIVEFFSAGPDVRARPRLVTGDMAERSGFSVDELDDVRLAVDELCGILIGDDPAPLRLRLQAVDGELVVEATTAVEHDPAGPSDLSEMLLRALVDSCTFDTSGHETSVVIRKLARDLQ